MLFHIEVGLFLYSSFHVLSLDLTCNWRLRLIDMKEILIPHGVMSLEWPELNESQWDIPHELLGKVPSLKWWLKKWWYFSYDFILKITLVSWPLPEDDVNSAAESLSLEACSTSRLPVMWENKSLCTKVFIIGTGFFQMGHFANYVTIVFFNKGAPIPMIKRAFWGYSRR